jgi:DNA-binding transcriptional LysR family regulator
MPSKTRAVDWNLLSAFAHLVNAGSLTKAAISAGVSQPTLSRQIRLLERQLGLELFERTARGMRLTEWGQSLVARASRMRDEADGIARTAQGLDTEVSGVVRISASELTANHLLPPVLTRLHQQHASIEFEVIATNSVSNLLSREADIAVRMAPPRQHELIARKVALLKVGIYAHKRYLRKHGVPKSLADLLKRDLIGFDQDDSLRKGLLAAGAPKNALRFAFRSDSHELCWQMVRAGFGCGIVTTLIAATDSDVLQVLPTAPVPSLPIWLTVHREVRSNKRLRLVYDALASALAKEQPHACPDLRHPPTD